MLKEENLHWESGEKGKISDKNTTKRATSRSKNKKKKAAIDTSKRIMDYFSTVPKGSKERNEENGVGTKDETRVTNHTTPDKSGFENGNSQAIDTNKGKQPHSNRPTRDVEQSKDICLRPHC